MKDLDLSFLEIDEKKYSEEVCASKHIIDITQVMSIIENCFNNDDTSIKIFKHINPNLTVKWLQEKYLFLMKHFIVVHERPYKGTGLDQSRYGTREERLMDWIKEDKEKMKLFNPEIKIKGLD